MKKQSFGAIVNDQTHVVILGSLPGEKSLEEKQYYAHRTNQFWRLMGGVIDEELNDLPYDARLKALLAARVGLWDVVASANRQGSLDTKLRDVRINRLDSLFAQLPNLAAIAFNGGAAAKIGRRQLPISTKCSVVDLPSSSAGYCAVTIEWKQRRWNELKSFL